MASSERLAQLANNNPNQQVQSTGPLASTGASWVGGQPGYSSILGSSLPSNAPVFFQSDLPSSMEAGQKLTFSQMAGYSGYQPQITTNGFYISHMPNGEHDELNQGDAVWVFNAALRPGNPAVPMLKTFHLNKMLRKNTNMALAAWTKALAAKQGIDGVAEYNDLFALSQLPTHAWRSSREFKDIMKRDHDVARAFAYLDLETVISAWNYYGVLIGAMEGKNSPAFRVVASLRKGVSYETNSIWGHNLLPFEYFGFIIKRQQDTLTSEQSKIAGIAVDFGPIQIIPWHGSEQRPEMSELSFIDVTGHQRYGIYIGIGRVLWHVDKPQAAFPYKSSAGITPATDRFDPNSPLRQRFRSSLQPRRGIKHNFYY